MADQSVTVHRARSVRLASSVGVLVVAGAALVVSPAAVVAGPARRPALGTVWVLNASSIVAYPPGSNGNAAPTATITGRRAGVRDATDLVVTPSGALWVSDPETNMVKEFAPGANGDAAPETRIAGRKTLLHSPGGLALASNGNLWVLNDDPSDSAASLSEFAAGAHGNVAPIERIAGGKARLFPAGGIAISGNGKHLWVTHVEAGSGLDSPAVQEFRTSTPGNVAATRTIAGAHTEFDFPYGVVVDREGDLIVSDDADRGTVSAILTFAATASGNVAPTRVVSGATTGIMQPSYLTLDALGKIWEPNVARNSLGRFASTASGDVAPKATIVGNKTGLHRPNAIAVYFTKPGVPRALAVRRRKHRRLEVTWQAPSDNGGGILGYRLLTKSSTHGAWVVVTQSKHKAFTTTKLAKHRRHFYEVVAFNEDGASPRTAPASRVIS
jgi:hypothetical protein